MQVDSTGGNKYFGTFIDDFSMKLWTYLIKHKSDVFDVFNKFKSMVERQSSCKIKKSRIDGGGEYLSSNFADLCEKEGIIHDVVHHILHSIMELLRERIMNMVRSMLKAKNLPKHLWVEAVATATYLLNRCPTKKLWGVTLEEKWSGMKPDVNI